MKKLVMLAGCLLLFSVSAYPQGSPPGGYASPSPSGTGTLINVKNYGAKGDARFSAPACTLTSGQSTATCPGAIFNAGDVGKRFNCGLSLGSGFFFPVGTTTIASIVSSTQITTNPASTANGSTSVASCAWGTVDDAAIGTAVTAWATAIKGTAGQPLAPFTNSSNTSAPVLYFPTGGYMVCSNTNGLITQTGSQSGAKIMGDAGETWLIPCDVPANPGGNGFFINQGNGANYLLIEDISIDGMFYNNGSSIAVNLGGTHHTRNLYITRWNGGAAFQSQGNGYNLNLVVNNSGQPGVTGALVCSTCHDEFRGGGSSNNGNNTNVLVQNTLGLNVGTGPRFINVLVDECGSLPDGCTKAKNAQDVWFIGSSLFSTTSGQGLNVDSTSYVHINGGIVGVFGSDSNSTGLKVQAGGIAEASDVRFVGTGTGKCIDNSGTFVNNGANTCESQFLIASGSEAANIVSLTLTTTGQNLNVNCAIGDTAIVENAAIAGYNGKFRYAITAVGANTVSYKAVNTGLGALGAGGTLYCVSPAYMSGNLPYSTLTPTPNTCYVTVVPFAAVTLCNQFIDRPINIFRIKATSSTTTSCTVAPVVTISDGTNSATLTLTTGKATWDSSVDTSTGVGSTIYAPRSGTLTISTTAGTCATPPTNFSLTYSMQAVIDN